MSRTSPTFHPSRVAEVLGYLALAPFVVGAALVWLGDAEWRAEASLALSVYAAVVIAFIGAIHWGIGFTQVDPAPRLFVWGVVPAIVACLVALVPPGFGLLNHAVLLVICYRADRYVYPLEGVARWLPLRLRLTVVAVASCLVGALGCSRG